MGGGANESKWERGIENGKRTIKTHAIISQRRATFSESILVAEEFILACQGGCCECSSDDKEELSELHVEVILNIQVCYGKILELNELCQEQDE